MVSLYHDLYTTLSKKFIKVIMKGRMTSTNKMDPRAVALIRYLALTLNSAIQIISRKLTLRYNGRRVNEGRKKQLSEKLVWTYFGENTTAYAFCRASLSSAAVRGLIFVFAKLEGGSRQVISGDLHCDYSPRERKNVDGESSKVVKPHRTEIMFRETVIVVACKKNDHR